MIILGIVHSLIGANKVYHLLKDPEHPKHHWLKPLFGIPIATAVLGLLLTSAEQEAGPTILLLTLAIFWAVVQSILFSAEDILGPQPVTARMRLERYLYPFDQEPPADRSTAFVLNTHRLTPIEGPAASRPHQVLLDAEAISRGLEAPSEDAGDVQAQYRRDVWQMSESLAFDDLALGLTVPLPGQLVRLTPAQQAHHSLESR